MTPARIAWVPLAFWAACSESDLGTPCHLLRSDNSEVQPMAGHDIVLSGSGECVQFVCASFAGAPARCTEPCTKVGDSCAHGWRCRPAVLSPETLVLTVTRTRGTDENANGIDDADEITGGLTESTLCAPPP